MKKQQLDSGEKVVTIEEQDKQNNEIPVIKRHSLSAYQLFMKDKKAEGKFTLQVLSQMWKELPLDYKEQYQEKARQQKDQIIKNVQHPESKQRLQLAYFPQSRLKTILKEDEDRPQFRQEGYIYLLKAIEGFGEILLNHVKDKVKQDSRKIVKEDDLITVLKENEEFLFLDCLASHHQKKKTSLENKQNQNVEKTCGAMDKYLEKNNGQN